MKRLGVLSSIIASALAAALLTGSPLYAQDSNWTLGDVDAPSHWGPTAGNKFSEAVDAATEGRLKITVYPAESLFKGKDSLDAVSEGLTQMYRVAGVHVAGEEQILELLDLPMFLAADYDFRNKVWDALTPMYRDLLSERYGIYLAGILQAEPRMIYTKEPIENLADLAGRKLRSAGPVETQFTTAIGIVPVAVAPSEIYTALQQGLIDGNWVADAPHFFNKGFEVTKYIYDIGSGGAGFFVLVNENELNALSEEDRAALMDALPGYVADLREGSRNGAVNGRQWLIDEGMTVVEVSDEDRATMQKAAAGIVEEWRGRLDPESLEIFEKAKAMVDEYNAAAK
jgi:TRAP-type C4-dicarboxylate transport system substrate-binding protein